MATGGKTETEIFSDEIFDILCSKCQTEGKKTEGKKFCVECDDYFCVKCADNHNRRHNMLDKGRQVKPRTSQGRKQWVPAERCGRHSYKHIDMYCQNHDKVGCSTCMVADHK